jgi:hypothetical protein
LIKIDENQAQRENLSMKKLTVEEIQQHYAEWEAGVARGDEDKFVPGEVGPDGQPIELEPIPVISVNDWDNHAVHIEVHNRFRKSQSFDLLPPEIKAEFQKHIAIHQNALQNQMMLQQMGAQMPVPEQGAPSDAQQPTDQGTPEQSGMTEEQLG